MTQEPWIEPGIHHPIWSDISGFINIVRFEVENSEQARGRKPQRGLGEVGPGTSSVKLRNQFGRGRTQNRVCGRISLEEGREKGLTVFQIRMLYSLDA